MAYSYNKRISFSGHNSLWRARACQPTANHTPFVHWERLVVHNPISGDMWSAGWIPLPLLAL
jgi:hypothetical protein